jgi:hypothetical protein
MGTGNREASFLAWPMVRFLLVFIIPCFVEAILTGKHEVMKYMKKAGKDF